MAVSVNTGSSANALPETMFSDFKNKIFIHRKTFS